MLAHTSAITKVTVPFSRLFASKQSIVTVVMEDFVLLFSIDLCQIVLLCVSFLFVSFRFSRLATRSLPQIRHALPPQRACDDG